MNETTRHTPVPDSVRTASLGSLFLTFLKIGSTAFGGFMALISVVQNYVVERRKLISHEEMLDGVSLATILPGPVAVNVVAYVGYRMRGWLGALVSAGAVILPSFLLLVCLSYAYFRFGQMPAVGRFFIGVHPCGHGHHPCCRVEHGKEDHQAPYRGSHHCCRIRPPDRPRRVRYHRGNHRRQRARGMADVPGEKRRQTRRRRNQSRYLRKRFLGRGGHGRTASLPCCLPLRRSGAST